MPWLSPSDCVRRVGSKKLAQWTTNSDERSIVDFGDGSETEFELPFFLGTAPTVYVDDVAVAPTISRATPLSNWTATFGAPPALNAVIEAQNEEGDGINTAELNDALLRAQAEIGGFLRAGGGEQPADGATDVEEPVKGWSGDVAFYYLITSPKRQILASNPGVVERYADITGLGPAAGARSPGNSSLLRDYAKARFSLSERVTAHTAAADEARVGASEEIEEEDLNFGDPNA